MEWKPRMQPLKKLKKLFNSGNPSRREVEDFVEAAGRGNNTAVTDFLNKHPGHIDKKGFSGLTALMRAAMMGQMSTVQLLLEKGAAIDLKTRHYDQATALTHARRANQHNIARLLESWPEIPQDFSAQQDLSQKKSAPGPKH